MEERGRNIEDSGRREIKERNGGRREIKESKLWKKRDEREKVVAEEGLKR